MYNIHKCVCKVWTSTIQLLVSPISNQPTEAWSQTLRSGHLYLLWWDLFFIAVHLPCTFSHYSCTRLQPHVLILQRYLFYPFLCSVSKWYLCITLYSVVRKTVEFFILSCYQNNNFFSKPYAILVSNMISG